MCSDNVWRRAGLACLRNVVMVSETGLRRRRTYRRERSRQERILKGVRDSERVAFPRNDFSAIIDFQIFLSSKSAPLAQLDRASGYEPEGREFESLRAHHFFPSGGPLNTSRAARSSRRLRRRQPR